MPYPHVTQFETLDLRRQHTMVVPGRVTVAPARARRGLPRLLRRPRRSLTGASSTT